MRHIEQNEDHELILRAKDGDMDAFENLVKKYQQPVYALCRRMTGVHQSADDLSQETFIKVYLSLKKFKSGDDVHLTERFRYLDTGNIEYCADPETFVETFPPIQTAEIFHQQIRKNSKILLSTPSSIFMALVIFIYYMLTALIPIIFPKLLVLWLITIIVKILIELSALSLANKKFRQKMPFYIIMIFQLIYPLHIIFFSVLGLFQVYKWKK